MYGQPKLSLFIEFDRTSLLHSLDNDLGMKCLAQQINENNPRVSSDNTSHSCHGRVFMLDSETERGREEV